MIFSTQAEALQAQKKYNNVTLDGKINKHPMKRYYQHKLLVNVSFDNVSVTLTIVNMRFEINSVSHSMDVEILSLLNVE